MRYRGLIALLVLLLQLLSCHSKSLAIELFIETDVPRDRALTVFVSARGGVPRGPILPFPASAMFFEFSRNDADGGVVIPGSVVINPSTMESTALVEVTAVVDRTATTPAATWRQYAVVQGTPGVLNTVRMFLSQRCGSPARGCQNVVDLFCTAAIVCADRGLTCGEDGQCVRPDGWATFASDAGVCGANRCGPGCPPCAAGSGCSDGGFCTPTPDGSVPCRDEDHDGFGVGFACVERDCNDRDRDTFPGAVELCDSKDNDCNGMVDEGACVEHTNTSCATATVLDLTTQAQSLTIHPDTSRGAFGATVRCDAVQSNTGKQLWYAIRYPQNETLDIRAIASNNPNAHPVLYLQQSCEEPVSLACSESTLHSLVNARVLLRATPNAPATAATVYVMVGGYQQTASGPTRLTVSREAQRASNCDQPFDVGIGGSIASITGTSDVLPAVCAPRAFPEDVYRVPATGLCAVSKLYSTDAGVVLYDVCPAPRASMCFNANGALWGATVPTTLATDGISPATRYFATFTATTEQCP